MRAVLPGSCTLLKREHTEMRQSFSTEVLTLDAVLSAVCEGKHSLLVVVQSSSSSKMRLKKLFLAADLPELTPS